MCMHKFSRDSKGTNQSAEMTKIAVDYCVKTLENAYICGFLWRPDSN